MPPAKITSKTGSAPIVKQGHTASSAHGTNPDAQRKYPKGTRDLSK